MADFDRDNVEIYKGLQKTFQRMKGGSQNAYLKIFYAQEHYFSNNPELSSCFIEESRELLKAALRKFEYAAMVGEQMHSIREIRNLRDYSQVQRYYDVPSEGEGEVPFLDELLFDQSLFIWRAFLDFYMKYLVYFCAKIYVENMSVKVFNKNMKNAETNSKSQLVFTYFQQGVFNEETDISNWGNLLRSFRDKTAHNKLITLTMKEIETRTGQKRLEPTIQDQPVSFFVQHTFENNAFTMFQELLPILYAVEWIPGSYKPGMYQGERL
ncbi:MAG: hypothetical protein AAGU15_04410 [Anaerolineaceae bacterium]